jgi:hypothetical protein
VVFIVIACDRGGLEQIAKWHTKESSRANDSIMSVLYDEDRERKRITVRPDRAEFRHSYIRFGFKPTSLATSMTLIYHLPDMKLLEVWSKCRPSFRSVHIESYSITMSKELKQAALVSPPALNKSANSSASRPIEIACLPYARLESGKVYIRRWIVLVYLHQSPINHHGRSRKLHWQICRYVVF